MFIFTQKKMNVKHNHLRTQVNPKVSGGKWFKVTIQERNTKS